MAQEAVELVPNLVIGSKSNGRCRYDAIAKRALVLRCLQPGVSLAATALAHGLNANLVRKWVVKYAREHGMPRPARKGRDLPAILLPVHAAPGEAARPAGRQAISQVEICVGRATIRVMGQVDEAQLRAIIGCVSSLT